MFLTVLAVKSTAQVLLEALLEHSLHFFQVPKLPSRVPPIMKGLERLEAKDYCFLLMNQAIETAFLLHLFFFLGTSDHVERSFATFKNPMEALITTIPPFYMFFYIDDFFYYWFHRFMHLPLVYPYCHKHHHRQALPRRGYFDAANENPLEQIGGLGCVVIAFYLVKEMYKLIGLKIHAAVYVTFMAVYAIFAFLNHTEFDFKLGSFGLGYSVRAHEMHHRFPRCNYAQNTMMWDRLLGSFKEYRSGQKEQ